MEANLGAHGANQRRGARPTLQSEEGGGWVLEGRVFAAKRPRGDASGGTRGAGPWVLGPFSANP